ncbi:heparin lyase I family protein [Neiella sp. HB171785]|uniref:Heparin lyase I family protein n=1 Tax=Neiella litorisoli TaxID=2771431 RepID=A0A8J6QHQ9_9GAMM|nr:heparin lyase I family protein [Neiella litorisoli]MBD1388737.1 heparin lyase I family protein [Neiella litorisoli]
MRKLFLSAVLIAPLCATAQVDWYADPNKPLTDSFRRLDQNAGSSTTCADQTATSSNPTVSPYGKMWKIDKPVGARRGEYARTEGFIHPEGRGRFYGWRFRINSNPDAVDKVTVFQWKTAIDSNGTSGTQNYPINMEYEHGTLKLEAFGPCTDSNVASTPPLCSNYPSQRKVTLKSVPLPEFGWGELVLKIFKDDDPNEGYVEFYYNGVQQTLSNGSPTGDFRVTFKNGDYKRAYLRTSDGDVGPQDSKTENMYPKWGVYNLNSCGYDVNVFFDEMRVGRSFNDVDPSNYD